MLKHVLYNSIGSFAMVVYFLGIFLYTVAMSFADCVLPVANCVLSSSTSSVFTSEKIVDKISTGSEFHVQCLR
jgi:hypothetical protein